MTDVCRLKQSLRALASGLTLALPSSAKAALVVAGKEWRRASLHSKRLHRRDIDLHNADQSAELRDHSAPVLKRYGAKVGNPTPELREGPLRPMAVVLELPDIDAARNFYGSQGYTEALAIREQCTDTDLMIVEGMT
ncbi:MAG: DUF1330 domain-containing protein [Sulfitobacter sp.]|nr:DUF1330 domain-containing protein [Sulfitobacter sp.]